MDDARAKLRVLLYKRNHRGDPDYRGTFGCDDCMGRIRSYRYDAVIGIGVDRPNPGHEAIAGRITWVGVGPRAVGVHHDRGAPVLRFDRWGVWDEKGKVLREFAPELAEYFYEKHRRFFFSDHLSQQIQKDIEKILRLANNRRAGGNASDDGVSILRKPMCRKREFTTPAKRRC